MRDFLTELGIEEENSGAAAGEFLSTSGDWLECTSPIDGKPICKVRQASVDDYEKVVSTSVETFKKWRTVPAPKRGEVVRQIGNAVSVRTASALVGALVGALVEVA